MTKKSIKKISDKLKKVSDSFTINMLDNGFVIEISGRDHCDEWTSAKIMCSTIEDLSNYIKEASEMEKE